MNPLTIVRSWFADPDYLAVVRPSVFAALLVVGAVFALRGLA